MQGLSRMNLQNEWQSYINQGLDENWDLIDEEEDLDFIKNIVPYGIPYVKSISKLDDGEHESRGSERWVKEKLEEIAFKIQDQNYDECAKLFDILTENVPPHKDKLVSLIDETYSSYVNDLSRSIMMSGSEKHIKALIICDAKITAKSFLFYQSSLLRINLQKIDTTNKPAKQFEDELTTFTNHMILTKKNYIKLFSEDNQLLVDSIENSSLLKPWIEEQLEILISTITKFLPRLKAYQTSKEFTSILRNATNELEKNGISVTYKIEEVITDHDLFSLANEDETNMLKVISELD